MAREGLPAEAWWSARIRGMPVGVGEPVFDKLDACLAAMSIGQ